MGLVHAFESNNNFAHKVTGVKNPLCQVLNSNNIMALEIVLDIDTIYNSFRGKLTSCPKESEDRLADMPGVVGAPYHFRKEGRVITGVLNKGRLGFLKSSGVETGSVQRPHWSTRSTGQSGPLHTLSFHLGQSNKAHEKNLPRPDEGP